MKLRPAVVFALGTVACSDGAPTAPQGGALAGADMVDAVPPTRLVVLSTDYVSGVASALDLATLAPLAFPVFNATGATARISGDTVARVAGRTLVLLDRAQDTGDNATFFDLRQSPPARLAQVGLLTPAEAAATPGARPPVNAHDLLVVDGARAYVARWQLASLAVLSTRSGVVTQTIDLAPYRGTAVLPYPDALARVGSEVWVTLERLDPNVLYPTQSGLVVRIDPARDAVLGTIDLGVPNPVGAMLPAPDGNGVVVAAPGDYHRMGDGGVVQVTPDGHARLIVSEQDVGGNVDGLAVLDSHRVLVKVAGIESSEPTITLPTRLVEFDLTTRRAHDWKAWTLWNPAAPVVVGARVYVGDPGDQRHAGAGVRVYGLDGTEITTAPVPVRAGLFPYDMRPAP